MIFYTPPASTPTPVPVVRPIPAPMPSPVVQPSPSGTWDSRMLERLRRRQP